MSFRQISNEKLSDGEKWVNARMQMKEYGAAEQQMKSWSIAVVGTHRTSTQTQGKAAKGRQQTLTAWSTSAEHIKLNLNQYHV